MLALDYEHVQIGRSCIVHADCFAWLSRLPENTLHAIVTDPPYGVKEYDSDQLEKRANGKGGIWRIPPSFDGHTRSPLPRFTALNPKERDRLREFFVEWGRLACRALRPGAHVFIATNAFIAQLLYDALVDGGLEYFLLYGNESFHCTRGTKARFEASRIVTCGTQNFVLCLDRRELGGGKKIDNLPRKCPTT